MSETIQVLCDLRNILTQASEESVLIRTAIAMGLFDLFERLAKRAHELNDPELEEVLHILCL